MIKLSLSLVLGYRIISRMVSNRHSHLIFSREKENLIKSQQALIQGLFVINIFIVYEKSSTTSCVLPFLSEIFEPFLTSYCDFSLFD